MNEDRNCHRCLQGQSGFSASGQRGGGGDPGGVPRGKGGDIPPGGRRRGHGGCSDPRVGCHPSHRHRQRPLGQTGFCYLWDPLGRMRRHGDGVGIGTSFADPGGARPHQDLHLRLWRADLSRDRAGVSGFSHRYWGQCHQRRRRGHAASPWLFLFGRGGEGDPPRCPWLGEIGKHRHHPCPACFA